MEKDFCKFLTKIGLIDEDTSIRFIKIYNDVFREGNNVNIFELSFQILIAFFNNITNNQKNYLCYNLPLKYFEIHEKNKKEKLISIIMKNRLKSKINLLKYLYLWKNAININKKQRNSNANIFNKYNSLNRLCKRNMKNASSNSSYKYLNSNYFSNMKLNDKNYKSIINYDDYSYDTTFSKYTTPQLYLSKTIKNIKWDSGVKEPFDSNNEISYKNINKSASEGKIKTTKRINGFSYNSSSIIDDKTSYDYKEDKDDKESTYKSNIYSVKKSSSISPNRISNEQREKERQLRFDKLYYDDKKYKLTKEMKALVLDYNSTKDLTFNPNINKTPNLIKSRKGKLENRIQYYLEEKDKHSYKMKNKINEDLEQNYSFTPTINSPKISKTSSNVSDFSKTFNIRNELLNRNYIPAYIRLYEESKLRSQKKIKKEREMEEHITNLANSLNKNKSVVDYNKINELYENKEKNKIYVKVKNKVESEEGITFKPYIYKNRFAKNIKNNFYERNSKFLLDKEKFISLNQNLYKPKNKMSQNEKRRIVKSIINRLYSGTNSGKGSHNLGCKKKLIMKKKICDNNNKNFNSISME